jgi:hypothetical protein
MIIINSAMQQDNIKQLVENLTVEGITPTFVEKRGIQLMFEAPEKEDEIVTAIKKEIKETSWGGVLYFNVVKH